MFEKHKRFTVPLLVGIGVAGVVIGAGHASSTTESVSCEIQATSTNGMIALAGVVHADIVVSGSYRFRVASAGRSGKSNIQQGGNFTAGPDGAMTLGQVMLGGAGAVYDASLELTSNGMTIECNERVGGAI